MINKTVLITGSTGFLGSKVLVNLLKEGFHIIILKRTTSNIFRIKDFINNCKVYDIDLKSINEIFNENKIDIVIHLATNYGRNEESVIDIINSNHVFPMMILENAKKNHVSHFINLDTSLNSKVNFYSLTKSHFKDFLEKYSSNLNILNIELEYFYGPGDANWKFINMVFNKFANLEKEIKLTSGSQHRNFIYIDDVVNALNLVIKNLNEKTKGFKSIGIGADETISIKDLVNMCKQISNNKNTILNFGSIIRIENETKSLKCDNSYLKQLGWIAEVDLYKGLSNTWKSIKNN